MKIRCVWEHNGNDSILYSDNFTGAYTRGRTKEEAIRKMPLEIAAYLRWAGKPLPDVTETEIVQEKASELTISDADSDVLFDREREELKALALKSARDFLALYEAVPDGNKSCLPVRTTFYGPVPRTAYEMYEHTKNVNRYYFSEIGVAQIYLARPDTCKSDVSNGG